MDSPNYTRIINETTALRKLQLTMPGRVGQQVFYWSENRIHEEEHAERIRIALRRWGEERDARGCEQVDLWNYSSETEDEAI